MALLDDVKKTKPTAQTKPGQTRRGREDNIDFVIPENTGHETVDEAYAKNAYRANLQQARGLGDPTRFEEGKSSESIPSKPRSYIGPNEQPEVAEEFTEESAEAANDAINQARATSLSRMKLARGSQLAAVSNVVTPVALAARARATTVNAAAFSWGVPLWLFVQLPFAVFGTATLGVVGMLEQVTATATSEGFLTWAANVAKAAVTALAAVIGLDFAEIALSVFFVCYTVVLAVGLFTILSLYIQYTLGMLRPLSGNGEGLKLGMLLLAFIGYCVPVLNMFPFVLLWMAAVWVYPR